LLLFDLFHHLQLVYTVFLFGVTHQVKLLLQITYGLTCPLCMTPEAMREVNC